MHKMRCIRQVNKNYFPFLHNFVEMMILAFWGVCWTEKSRNINENERRHKTTLNIHIFLMECTRKLKFDMMMYHYLFNSFGYSISQNCRFYKYKNHYVQN